LRSKSIACLACLRPWQTFLSLQQLSRQQLIPNPAISLFLPYFFLTLSLSLTQTNETAGHSPPGESLKHTQGESL
jgi:hypothetical protein